MTEVYRLSQREMLSLLVDCWQHLQEEHRRAFLSWMNNNNTAALMAGFPAPQEPLPVLAPPGPVQAAPVQQPPQDDISRPLSQPPVQAAPTPVAAEQPKRGRPRKKVERLD